ncbi:hypothetical protein HBI81_243640 [Parastagonospora nodorum]|nr:hypothetical protein HBI18_249860 [Parastagonospora nodorum]KAH6511550.1 hypothetical protein HBI81_243640 [Parastagonospora nodorum]
MALAHNGMIRGLNSIYLQAPHIPHNYTSAQRDFLMYCECWCESMHHHHGAEEAEFFPSLEKIAAQPELMAQIVDQHRAFTPGFEKSHGYVEICGVKDFDGPKIQALVQDFAPPLTKHLQDEIETLKAREKHDSKEMKSAYKRLEKLLMDTDNKFRGWVHDFPSAPFFVPYVIHYRFNPCTMWRDPKESAFKSTETES